MPRYKYRAKKGPDDILEGIIEAKNENEAIEKLSQTGYLPLSLDEEGAPAHEKHQVQPIRSQGRIKSREITIFSRQLASLLKAGVPILSALSTISEQSENTRLREVLISIHDSVKAGETFSSAIEQHANIFSPLFVAMVRSGENSGVLPEVLLRIADYRIKQEEMVSRFRMALAYPALMAIVGAGTVVFMLTFVMPRLMGIFSNMGQNLPLPTQILISTSYALRKWWLIISIIVLAIFEVSRRESRTKAGKMSFSVLKLHLPVLGKFILKVELARFCRTLEMLIRNGIPILRAIDIAIPVIDNEIIKNRLRLSYKELEQGGYFGKSLRGAKLFPMFMTNLITVGEESGRLDEALAEVAISYETDTDESIKIMSSLLEPVMILIMGLIVGFIVLAMLLPIFQINIMVR